MDIRGAGCAGCANACRVQATQPTAMQSECQSAIVGGFTSSALGSPYSYPSDPVTQTNIMLATIAGGSLWCQPSGGKWAYTAHTATEAQAVRASLAAWIQAQQTTYAGLLTNINAATTVAGVQAVAWP